MQPPNLRRHTERTLKSCKVILASGSPRRKDLLQEMGIDIEILVPEVDEKSVLDHNPKRLVIKEALLKNRSAREQFDCDGKVVISADTIVYRGKEYTKPRDLQNAVEILTELCGKWHSVYTGVVVSTDNEEIAFAVRSKVRLKNLSQKEIENYVYTFKPLDKGLYTKLQITVQYTYIGKETYKGTPVYHIKAKWATRYGSGTLYHDWEGDESLTKATGSHTADIMVSIETGAAILIRDTVDETFFYDDGNYVTYKGSILLFTEFPPSIDKTEITNALSKIATVKTESNSEDYYKDGVLFENPSISNGYSAGTSWNDDVPFQVNTSSGYLGNGGSETTFVPKPSTPTVVTKPAVEEAKNDMVVEETDAGLRLSVRNLQFIPDSSQLLPSERNRLDEIAKVLKLAPKATFLVEGHSASTGNPTGEKNLSVERAKSIVDELVKRGIPANQFIFRGLGSEVPIADNSTSEGKALNRRVEITILE